MTDLGLTTDVAHDGAAATRHSVAAVDLGEGRLTLVTGAHFRHRHSLLAASRQTHTTLTYHDYTRNNSNAQMTSHSSQFKPELRFVLFLDFLALFAEVLLPVRLAVPARLL